jgi:hypothetical protein
MALLGVACSAPPPPAAASKTPEPAPQSQAVDELVVTPAAMANFIAAFFSNEAKGTGYMTVKDPVTGTDLRLKLQPMTTAEMNSTGMGIYYTCVPMEDEGGALWDVDFISQKTDRGMSFIEASVHKTPTETRYEWVKNDREVWEKRQ